MLSPVMVGRTFSSIKTLLIRLFTTFDATGALALDQRTTPEVVTISKQSNIVRGYLIRRQGCVVVGSEALETSRLYAEYLVGTRRSTSRLAVFAAAFEAAQPAKRSHIRSGTIRNI